MSEFDDPLWRQAYVQERPFTSQTPIVGNLLVWLRTRWLNMAARWYVRPLIQQQNQLNRQFLAHMQALDGWLITQDRDQAILQRETAVLTTQLVSLRQQMEAAAQRLAQLEQLL